MITTIQQRWWDEESFSRGYKGVIFESLWVLKNLPSQHGTLWNPWAHPFSIRCHRSSRGALISATDPVATIALFGSSRLEAFSDVCFLKEIGWKLVRKEVILCDVIMFLMVLQNFFDLISQSNCCSWWLVLAACGVKAWEADAGVCLCKAQRIFSHSNACN